MDLLKKESVEELRSMLNDCELLNDKTKSEKTEIAKFLVNYGVKVPLFLVNDIVYVITSTNEIKRGVVRVVSRKKVGICPEKIYLHLRDKSGFDFIAKPFENNTRYVYFTKEQAEKALKEREK